FELYEGETFAIVGESGCGKSVTSQSIMRLLPKFSATITDGAIRFKGKDLRHLSEKEMRKIRGAEISMIFQDPMTALNPTLTVGDQLTEALLEHRPVSKTDARKAVISMLELVGIPNPQERLRQYPHQFSGGMRQRI
ncbi:ATP-binding cassette domain-containing protein, partial [Bacillus haynesii]